MAHTEQFEFIKRVRSRFPEHFQGNTLDCGSYDINGSFRGLVQGIYTGIDMQPGPNVDRVIKTHEFPIEDGPFDLVLSGEMLEHDEHWAESLDKMQKLLKPGGLLAITCAYPGRDVRTYPWCEEHYKNLQVADIMEAFMSGPFSHIDTKFTHYGFEINNRHHDLYFWGLKK